MRVGPSERELTRAFLAGALKRAALWLYGFDVDELAVLFDEMLELPGVDVSLQVRLPRLSSPVLEGLRTLLAMERPDPDAVDAAIDAALPLVDVPEERARLVRALLALRNQGRVGVDVSAAAIVELAGDGSAFMSSSLGQAVAVSVGTARTPSGLLIVAR